MKAVEGDEEECDMGSFGQLLVFWVDKQTVKGKERTRSVKKKIVHVTSLRLIHFHNWSLAQSTDL